jgi:uncharacterized protein YdaU (DUF1376 family)
VPRDGDAPGAAGPAGRENGDRERSIVAPAEAPAVPFLAVYPWDVERWRNSDAYEELSLAEQGAYLNLCFRAWQEQPHCRLPNDDSKLWRKANARSLCEWRKVRDAVLARWEASPDGAWITHPVVLETYAESRSRHDRAVEHGRIAGHASARARRNSSKISTGGQLESNPSPTRVNPPSPSPSPSTEEHPLSPSFQEGETVALAERRKKAKAERREALERLLFHAASLGLAQNGLRARIQGALGDGFTEDALCASLDAEAEERGLRVSPAIEQDAQKAADFELPAALEDPARGRGAA